MKQPYINPHKLFVGSFLPNWLLRRPEVSLGAKCVYARLCQHAGHRGVAYPRREVLAPELGISVSQVDRYIRQLQDQKLIKVEQVGLRRANRYFFLYHPWMENSENEVPDSADMRTQDSSHMRTPLKRIIRTGVAKNRDHNPTCICDTCMSFKPLIQ